MPDLETGVGRRLRSGSSGLPHDVTRVERRHRANPPGPGSPGRSGRIVTLLAPTVAMLLVSAGCGTGGPEAAPTSSATTVTTAAPASPASPTTAPTCSSAGPPARLLSKGYSLVVDSRGHRDHATSTKAFAQQTLQFTTDFRDCPDLAPSSATLAIQAARIDSLPASETDSDAYQLAREDGQHLFDALGITDLKFGEDPPAGR